jgi:hypothetical protein
MIKTRSAGNKTKSQSLKFKTKIKIHEPKIKKKFERNCIKACAKN